MRISSQRRQAEQQTEHPFWEGRFLAGFVAGILPVLITLANFLHILPAQAYTPSLAIAFFLYFVLIFATVLCLLRPRAFIVGLGLLLGTATTTLLLIILYLSAAGSY